jgi:hypothetical protein
MSSSEPSSLDRFKYQEGATEVAELDTETPDAVVEAFDEMCRWESAVVVNKDSKYAVGQSPNAHENSYRLYQPARGENPYSFAGIVKMERSYTADWSVKAGFIPAGGSKDDEVLVEPVEHLVVESADRTETVDGILQELRTGLTNSDWSDERADTGYGEWIEGANRLAEFAQEWQSNETSIPSSFPQQPRVMHSLFRYPHDCEKILCQAVHCIEDNYDEGVYEVSPEAFREFLIAAYNNICHETD